MGAADRVLGAVYRKAAAADRYVCRFNEGGHKFDLQMQAEAFDWLDRWLQSASPLTAPASGPATATGARAMQARQWSYGW